MRPGSCLLCSLSFLNYNIQSAGGGSVFLAKHGRNSKLQTFGDRLSWKNRSKRLMRT